MENNSKRQGSAFPDMYKKQAIGTSPRKLILHRRKIGNSGKFRYTVTEDGKPIAITRTSNRDYVACTINTRFGTNWCGRFDLIFKGDAGKRISKEGFYGIAIREDLIETPDDLTQYDKPFGSIE